MKFKKRFTLQEITLSASKRILAVAVALALTISFIPRGAKEAFAAEVVAGLPAIKVTDGNNVGTLIGFAGEEWYVIGDGTKGVYLTAPANSLTLLVKGRPNPTLPADPNDPNADWSNYDDNWSNYGASTFRMNWMYLDAIQKPNDMSQFTSAAGGDGYWYSNNPGETPGWAQPNEYRGSTLQQRMEEIAGEYGNNTPREYALINGRTLTPTSDGSPSNYANYRMMGAAVPNQKLWPLSYYEWAIIGNENVRKYTTPYWFRAAFTQNRVPYAYFGYAPGSTAYGLQLGPGGFYNGYLFSMAARPALNLDMSKLLFTSEASANGKPAASLGDGLVPATPNTGAKLKFTMIDEDTAFLNLDVPDKTPRIAAPGGTVGVDYKDAITGANKYVSCVITDNDGNVLYYGKLNNTADGKANIPLPADMPIGSYKIKLFNEQVNGDNYTDFSSVPIEIPLTVALTPPEPQETPEPPELPEPPHLAFVAGYPDGTVRPEANITRAEVCQIIYRIILSAELKAANVPTENPFPDISEDAWYKTAVLTCYKLGLVVGYPDGEFKPNNPITRPEIAQIFGGEKAGGVIAILGAQDIPANMGIKFTDIDAIEADGGFWATKAIYHVAHVGWMFGRTPTEFDVREMTRAEFMTMMNRILWREPELPRPGEALPGDLLDGMKTWPDNANIDMWYYREVQEATNSHEYERKDTKSPTRAYFYEKWTQLLK
ncbi:MAG: S-layer homology domain-containing protein [Oscillospiraceae bacterium]|jgi:hypothetical protein|nr:S-layer homology domain-containing protein [Oscillospiraceae bacterium]